MIQHAPTREREATLAIVRETASELFAAHPQYRSVLFAVAQYWNDQASDECHSHLIASVRNVPQWPHFCPYDEYDEQTGEVIPSDRDEICSDAQYEILRGPYLNVYAWEPYCHEHANQGQEVGEAYMPYAIARRRGDGSESDSQNEIDIEIIGCLQRPSAELVTGEPVRQPWLDPRARELYELVCASPDDDGPRAVLGDYLLTARKNAVDPRGEYIALALRPELDARGRARRDELLAGHERLWLAPLGSVIPMGCAWFARGFLVRADVYARTAPSPAVLGSSAWGTVEVLRMLPGSIDLVDPAMVALRELGPVSERGLAILATAAQPWRIERLQVTGALAPLAEASTLPRLRHLLVDTSRFDELVKLASGAPWWPGLDRLTLVDDHAAGERTLATWHERYRSLDPLPWLAVVSVGENREPAGWQIAFGPAGAVVIDVPGWHPGTTLDALVALVRELPAAATITLASSPCFVATSADLAYVTEHSGRTVSLDDASPI